MGRGGDGRCVREVDVAPSASFPLSDFLTLVLDGDGGHLQRGRAVRILAADLGGAAAARGAHDALLAEGGWREHLFGKVGQDERETSSGRRNGACARSRARSGTMPVACRVRVRRRDGRGRRREARRARDLGDGCSESFVFCFSLGSLLSLLSLPHSKKTKTPPVRASAHSRPLHPLSQSASPPTTSASGGARKHPPREPPSPSPR